MLLPELYDDGRCVWDGQGGIELFPVQMAAHGESLRLYFARNETDPLELYELEKALYTVFERHKMEKFSSEW